MSDRPTYDELEQALIVHDRTIAALRQQLSEEKQEVQRWIKTDSNRMLQAMKNGAEAIEAKARVGELEQQLAESKASVLEMERALKVAKYELKCSGLADDHPCMTWVDAALATPGEAQGEEVQP
jgi:predicted RNase H-like nuclease (RuvC/YqgF family)